MAQTARRRGHPGAPTWLAAGRAGGMLALETRGYQVSRQTDPGEVTRLLERARAGDSAALERLMPLIYEELKQVARSLLRGERPGHTLQTTALVNEAYLRMVDVRRVDWQGRAHFVALASRMMRRTLIDHARRRLALKRGGGLQRVTLDEEAMLLSERQAEELLALEEARQRLAAMDPRQAKVVDLRFFGGLSVRETAAVLEVSEKTVKRDWAVARAWLQAEVRSRAGA